MVTKPEVLKLVVRRSRENRATSYRTLVREFFPLSEEAACGHLKRLWDQRLIEPRGPRELEYRYRLEPGESLRELRFEITARGEARWRWWKKEEAKKRRQEEVEWLW